MAQEEIDLLVLRLDGWATLNAINNPIKSASYLLELEKGAALGVRLRLQVEPRLPPVDPHLVLPS